MKANKTLSLIAGIMLLLAVPSIWPYGFYQFLRWIVSVSAVFNAYQTYKINLKGWSVVMIVVAILFNPIAPIYLDKGVWVLIDVVVAITMFVLSQKFKKHE